MVTDAYIPQERLSALLKKKGIGPEGSKSLHNGEIEEVKTFFTNDQVSLTTRATMLTAFLMLSPNEEEALLLNEIKNQPEKILPESLVPFIKEENNDAFVRLIKKVINTEDLTEEECQTAMAWFFNPNTPDHLKGAFLEAERLKRESFTENQVVFNQLWHLSSHYPIETPLLIDLCDSYDAYNRNRNFSPFVAALLASAGFPAYLHGVEKVAPKEGVTSHQVLLAAGKNPLKDAENVKQDIKNPEAGWGYIDQKVFSPQLFDLRQMRKEMVKRPMLATFEKLLQPIQSTSGNLIVTGYTHPPYREETINQIKAQKNAGQALVVKGVEGSIQLSLTRPTVSVHYDGKNVHDEELNPKTFNFPQERIKQDYNVTPQIALEEGLAALRGEENVAYFKILFQSVVILTKFGLMEQQNALEKLSGNLKNGKALHHWEMGAH